MTTLMNKVVKTALVSAFIVLPIVSFADTIDTTASATVIPPVGGGDNGATVAPTNTLPPVGGGDNGATVAPTTSTLPPIGGGDNGATVAPVSTLPPIGGGDNGATAVDTTVTTSSSGGGSGATVYSSGSGGGSAGGLFVATTGTTTVTTGASSTLACPFLTNYIFQGQTNAPADVAKLQLFLNLYNNANLTVNGVLNDSTVNAVEAFQTSHLSDIMGPWGATQASGKVYITTLKEINNLVCSSPKNLSDADLAIINAYKTAVATNDNGNIGSILAPAAGAPGATSNVGSTSTVITPAGSSTPSILNGNASLVGNAIGAVGGFFKTVFLKIGSWF